MEEEYICKICLKKHTSFRSLSYHVKTIHDLDIYSYMIAHENFKPLMCEECKSPFEFDRKKHVSFTRYLQMKFCSRDCLARNNRIRESRKYKSNSSLKLNIPDNFSNTKHILIPRNKLLSLRKADEEKYKIYINTILKKKLLSYIRQNYPVYPVQQELLSRDKTQEVISYLQNIDIESYIDIKNKTIFNRNSQYCKELKRHFINFYDCRKKNGKSLKELFFSDKDIEQSILYRCGLNNSKLYDYKLDDSSIYSTNETFDISIETILRGLISKNKAVSFFYPVTAYVLCKHFLSDYDIIYDPSFGFGARYLAVKSLNKIYLGTDPDKETFNNLNLIKYDSHDVILNEKAENVTRDSLYILPRAVFSCPPYWNTENYSFDIKQEYATYENWTCEFVQKTAENIANFDSVEKIVYVLPESLIEDYISIYSKLNYVLDDSYDVTTKSSHFSRSKSKNTISEKCIILIRSS